MRKTLAVEWTHVWASDPQTYKLLQAVRFQDKAEVPAILARLDAEFPHCLFSLYNTLGTITKPRNVLVALNFDERGERLLDGCDLPPQESSHAR